MTCPTSHGRRSGRHVWTEVRGASVSVCGDSPPGWPVLADPALPGSPRRWSQGQKDPGPLLDSHSPFVSRKHVCEVRPRALETPSLTDSPGAAAQPGRGSGGLFLVGRSRGAQDVFPSTPHVPGPGRLQPLFGVWGSGDPPMCSLGPSPRPCPRLEVAAATRPWQVCSPSWL